MGHGSLDFMAHENAMEVGNWSDLNLMGHENMFSWPWKVHEWAQIKFNGS